MTFVFTDNETFEWPVTVCVPKDGDHTEVQITGIFCQIDDEEFFPDIDLGMSQGQAIEFEIDRLMMVFKGWREGDVVGPDNAPLEITDKTIRAFLNRRPNRLAVTMAYNQAVTPMTGARAKN